MNTVIPKGKPLRSGVDPAGIAEAVAARRPVVGNIVYGPTQKRHLYSVKVPVLRNGEVVYVLTAVIAPRRVQDILAMQELPAGALVTVADQNHVAAARSLNGAAWVGKPVSESLSRLLKSQERVKPAITRTLEGKPVYTIVQRSRHSGWTAAMGIPRELIDGPANDLRISLALGLVLSIAGGVLVAFHIGRTIFRLRRQEQEALEKAEQANLAKDEFLAMLGHELRNPLAPIVTATHLLKLAPHDPEKVLQANTVIDRNARHLVRLVNDLLDVSRVTRKLVTLQMQAVDLNSIVPEAVEQVEQLMVQHDHRLVTHLAPEPAIVQGDRTRLVQVAVNLLQNAAKFTADGGSIRLAIDVGADTVTMTVADNGIGMSPALIGQVFDLFKQGERGLDRSTGGLGIGLSLTRGLVELHGGRVTAESPGEGQGSHFIVTLPRSTA
jgi:signal transduction histidine kinase